MTDDRPSDLLGALPRSRPHRRSNKRPARPRSAEAAGTQPPAQGTQTEQQPKNGTAGRKAAADTTAARKPTAARGANSARKPKAARGTRSGAGANTRAGAPRPHSRRLPQPAQPRGVPRAGRGRRPEPQSEVPVLRTAVQAAAELAEIGFTLSAKALRGVAARLPRP